MNSTTVEFAGSTASTAPCSRQPGRSDQMDSMVTTRHAGRWTLTDRFRSAWHYLPFEVAPGACAIRVELEYERSGAIMDLGCMGAAGFRGWSGGSRRPFVITPTEAAPGYLPGRLEPGAWQIIICLYPAPPARPQYPGN